MHLHPALRRAVPVGHVDVPHGRDCDRRLHYRYITVTLPLHCRYITIDQSPVERAQVVEGAVTLPSHYRYITGDQSPVERAQVVEGAVALFGVWGVPRCAVVVLGALLRRARWGGEVGLRGGARV